MIVLVTGGSNGIGATTCNLFAEMGAKVYAASRSGTIAADADSTKVFPIVMDVTLPESVKNGVDTIIKREGRLDVVVCNAGNGIAGAIEETTLEEAKYQFETCFFGVHNTVTAVLPYLRKQGFGKIITTSSVAALVPIPYQAFYSSVKAALLNYSNALHIEVEDFGIDCCCILPGDTKTGFTSARKYTKAANEQSPYHTKRKASVAKMERDERNGMEPILIAKAIVKQAMSRRKMNTKVVPRIDYWAINLLVKILPNRLVLAIVKMLY